MAKHARQRSGKPADGQQSLVPDGCKAPLWDPENPYGPTANKPRSAVGSVISNTDPTLVTEGGLDWLQVTVYGFWERTAWAHFQPRLAALRDSAEDEGGEAAASVRTLKGYLIHGNAGGRRLGRHCYARFVIDVDGIEFAIVDRHEYNENRPSMVITIGSVALMERGHVACWGQALALLNDWGFKVGRAIPSRVDICVDLPGVRCSELVRPILCGRWVCRAYKETFHQQEYHRVGRRKWTGFSVGKHVRLRVYDKLEELKRSGDDRKLQVLIQRRYGGEMPKSATRVEYQLRRDILRDRFSIGSVDDLFSSLAVIVKWLTEDWCRITDGENRGRRTHELGTAPIWQKVQKQFAAFCAGAVKTLKPLKKVAPSPQRMVAQASGCISRAMALMGIRPDDEEQTANVVFQFFAHRLPAIAESAIEKSDAMLSKIGALPGAKSMPALPVPIWWIDEDRQDRGLRKMGL